MKRMLILLFVLISPVLAYAQLRNESQRPEINFSSESFDMGEVTQEAVMHSFNFKNTGTSELIIEKLVPS